MRNDGGANAQPGCRAICDAGAEARSILERLVGTRELVPGYKADALRASSHICQNRQIGGTRQGLPSGAEAQPMFAADGTAEAVPLQDAGAEARSILERLVGTSELVP